MSGYAARGITNRYIVESPGESDHRTGMEPEYFKKVRMLTPVECERLQGFPDGWTAYDFEHGIISDSKRYEMLGNSVAVPCVAYIMQGIYQVLSERSV